MRLPQPCIAPELARRMSRIAHAQAQTFLHLLHELRPHFHSDRNLPARIQQRLARERKFGSRDRRLYRELLYTSVRYLPWIDAALASAPDQVAATVVWLAGQAPNLDALRAIFLENWPQRPPETLAAAALLTQHLNLPTPLAPPFPSWFEQHAPLVYNSPECEALLARAPVWLRLQTADTSALEAELAAKSLVPLSASTIHPELKNIRAFKLTTDSDLTAFSSYQNGHFEIQDLASQLLLPAALPAQPSGHWLDACAGAGGKTLQLAQLLGRAGQIDAYDPRPAALRELSFRAARARLTNIRTLPQPPPTTALYDGVLIDAPCSGSGTWRRAPHLKWNTTEADLHTHAKLQLEILSRYAAHVQPGGQLIYATCSLSSVENENVIAAFLATHPDFAPAPLINTFGYTTPLPLYSPSTNTHQLTLWPSRFDTDAFFVASLRRR